MLLKTLSLIICPFEKKITQINYSFYFLFFLYCFFLIFVFDVSKFSFKVCMVKVHKNKLVFLVSLCT